MSTEKNNEWQERELGALWKRQSGDKKYLTGKIKNSDGSTQSVVIFKNKFKDKENQPDFRVYKSVEMASQSEPVAQEAGAETEQEDLL
jgi:uncharacterized protein (DUF736 family)